MVRYNKSTEKEVDEVVADLAKRRKKGDVNPALEDFDAEVGNKPIITVPRISLVGEDKETEEMANELDKERYVTKAKAAQAKGSIALNISAPAEVKITTGTTPAEVKETEEATPQPEPENPALRKIELLKGAASEANPALRRMSLFNNNEPSAYSPEAPFANPINTPFPSQRQPNVPSGSIVVQPATHQPEAEKEEQELNEVVSYLDNLNKQQQAKQARESALLQGQGEMV